MTVQDIDLGFVPRKWQLDVVQRMKRFNVLVVHRRAGKTRLAVQVLIHKALEVPGRRLIYLAPFLKQSKAVSWSMLKSVALLVPGVTINESELSVGFPNGSVIRLFGADLPDALRGLRIDGAVLDEVAQMKPDVWGQVIRPALSDGMGWVIFVGTPAGANLFSDLYYRALKGEPGWFGAMYRVSDTDAIEPEEIESARREMTPSQFAQEFDCDFAASVDNVLIPFQTVLDATRRELTTREHAQDAKVLGVDVARYGDDRSVAFLRQGKKAFPPRVWRGLDLMTLSSQVAELIDMHQPTATFVDQTGIGSGVVDRLRQLGRRVIGVDFGGKPRDEKFTNKRAEMWWLLSEWMHTASIPNMPELQAELTALTYSYGNAAGRLQLESKEDLKKRGLPSPDLADALALTFAEPVAHPGLQSARRFTVHRALSA